jgi:predicted nucleic acid-binding protein
MGPLEFEGIADGSLVLIDSAPLIYVLERNPEFSPRFWPLFEAHQAGRFRFAVSTITVTEVLTGALRKGDEALMERYQSILKTWQIVDVDLQIAQSAARIRVSLGLRTADAIIAASALAINAAALVTNDHDFARVTSLRILS